MNAPTRINSALSVRDQFPGIENWHYLDSAATAQKPRAVIDAITQAYARDYATVHRGVYQRSSEMTGRYEAARAAAAKLIGGKSDELVFTRGATEAINLVARSLPKDGRNRVLLSALEHHSNIVPWQLAGLRGRCLPADRRRPDRPRRRRGDAHRRPLCCRICPRIQRVGLCPGRQARG